MRTLILVLAIAVTGCSATSALTGLVGSKPEITAQAGAENTRQTLGLNNKVDASSEQETSFRDSDVGQVDTSSRKKVSASSISAQTITAERIEIRNGDDNRWLWIGIASIFSIACGVAFWFYSRK